MASIYGEMPEPLAQARRIGWVRYADHQDLAAGRVTEVAQRVLKRARRGRALLIAAVVVMIAIEGFSFWATLRLSAHMYWSVWPTGFGFVALQRMIRGLEELARGESDPAG